MGQVEKGTNEVQKGTGQAGAVCGANKYRQSYIEMLHKDVQHTLRHVLRRSAISVVDVRGVNLD